MRKQGFYVFLVLTTLVLSKENSSLSTEEYQKELNTLKQRETQAKEKIAQLEADVVSVKLVLDEQRQLTQSLKNKLYGKLGLTSAAVEQYQIDLQVFRERLEDIPELYANNPLGLKSAYEWAEATWRELREHPAARLKNLDSLRALTALSFAQVQESLNSMQQIEPPGPEEAIVEEPSPVAEPVPSYQDEEHTLTVSSFGSSHGTLWDISKKIYGKGQLWQRIWRANWPAIQNPDLIRQGQQLVIPAGPVEKPTGMGVY